MQLSSATAQSFQEPNHSRFGVPCTSQTMSQIKLATFHLLFNSFDAERELHDGLAAAWGACRQHTARFERQRGDARRGTNERPCFDRAFEVAGAGFEPATSGL